MAPDLGRAEALRAGVRLEALRRAADSSRALMGVGPIAAVSLVLLVAGPSPATRIGFVAFEIATVLLAVLALTLLLRHLDEPATRGRRTAVAIGALVLASLPWPLALVMLVPRDEVSSYLVLIFAIGAAAASLTASAAYAPFYLALVLGNLGPATILIAAGRVPPVPAGLAVMSVVYLALLCVSFLLLNRTLIDAIGGRLVEARLSAELTEANARLEYRATHDELTGLANRALFRERLREMLEDRSARDSVAVLYLDVDRFKVLNDSLGHVEGDALLQLVTERLSRAVRDTDLLARLGGDEFTVVAPGIDIDGALALAERLRAAFDEPFAIGGLSTAVSASIGVAMSRPGLTDVDLMRYADAALYAAKGAGRNRVSLFDDTTRALLSTRLERETTMRSALREHQFEAWYQPIVDPRTHQIVAVEALARWRHPRRGILAPGLFLPLMDEAGLAPDLDAEIARQARAFRRSVETLTPQSFRVFVNVSAGPGPLAETIERFRSAAAVDGTPLSGLGIEITERSVVSDPTAASDALTLARSQGVSVLLDDVGTGFSSLSLLRTIPLDGLKIDGSFVRGMARDAADAAVVASVTALARRLGLSVTGEGVELDEQLDALLAEGVTHVQGFLFSPAVPAEQLRSWLAEGPPWIAPAPVTTLRVVDDPA
jgi:diguanylate cyclase (GGDEF)-like protein